MIDIILLFESFFTQLSLRERAALTNSRSYMLDQPFTEPETVIVYPDSVYYGNGESSSSEDGTAGLIQRHLAIHEQQQQRDRGELSDDDPQEENSDSTQPILTTTTTTITTTTTRSITAPSPTLNLSTRGPTTITTLTTSAAAGSAAAAVEPSSGEESRGTAFLTGRHLSILRRGLKNITHHHHHRGENTGDRHSDSSPTEPHSPSSSSSSPRNSTVPAVVQMSLTPLDDPANASDSNRPEESETRESSSEERQAEIMGLPVLHRFRSMGPPPYIPLTAGEAPRLPPSYNTIVAETLPAEASSSTSTSHE
ncbi:hypothetical protein BGX34_010166 [Mortierella sp. NVP85]|nr:hypothetical protein BGX34_010166 [Mortierella sp. NVP85]